MTEQSGPGQADKKAAEEKTAQVAAENKSGGQSTAAEKVQASVDAGDTDTVDEAVAVDPYPAYEDRSLEELRGEAKSRGVEINRDVEKAHLVHALRTQEGPNPSFDLLPLEQLRGVAKEKGVELDEEFEKAHWITELRAADTHTL